MTPTAGTVPGTAATMAGAAGRFLESLDDGRRQQAVADFPGEPERTRWFYNPSDHGGLTLTDCSSVQRVAALQLLATGLSPAGYNVAAAIMGNELILERLEDWPVLPGWGRVRDPLRYAVTIFGNPRSAGWAWRFAGHHLSLHYTIIDGALAAATPSFFGADPAEAPLPGAEHCGPAPPWKTWAGSWSAPSTRASSPPRCWRGRHRRTSSPATGRCSKAGCGSCRRASGSGARTS